MTCGPDASTCKLTALSENKAPKSFEMSSYRIYFTFKNKTFSIANIYTNYKNKRLHINNLCGKRWAGIQRAYPEVSKQRGTRTGEGC